METSRGGTCNAEANFSLLILTREVCENQPRCLASVRGFHRTNLSRWLVINSCTSMYKPMCHVVYPCIYNDSCITYPKYLSIQWSKEVHGRISDLRGDAVTWNFWKGVLFPSKAFRIPPVTTCHSGNHRSRTKRTGHWGHRRRPLALVAQRGSDVDRVRCDFAIFACTCQGGGIVIWRMYPPGRWWVLVAEVWLLKREWVLVVEA